MYGTSERPLGMVSIMNENFLSLIFPNEEERILAQTRWEQMMEQDYSDSMLETMKKHAIDLRLLAGFVRFLVVLGNPNDAINAALTISLAYTLGYNARGEGRTADAEYGNKVLSGIFDIWDDEEE